MRKHAPLVFLTAVSAFALTSCGSGSPAGAEGSPDTTAGQASDGLETVTVGLIPLAASVAVHYGIQEGIFEQHGLEVEVASANSGAAMLPAVANNQMDIGVGNPLSVLTAVDKGMDVRIVSGYSHSADNGDDTAGVVTRADSGIQDFGDLAGRTTSINALRTAGDLTLMDLAEKAGADPADLKFSEMPFQDMPAQLERGNTDAIWIPEPFLSAALESPDNSLLGYSFRESIHGMPTLVTFTSGSFAEENPETVEKFQAAVSEALAATDDDNASAQELLPDLMSLPEEVAQNLKLDELGGEVRTDQLQQIGDLAVKYDFLSKDPDLPSMIID